MLRSACLALVLPAAFHLPLTAQVPPGYYDSVDTSSASTLRPTLHAVIDDHTRFPYTSGSTDTWNILELADEDPANASRILDVYRNTSYPKAGGGNSNYNREHTWPTSYGFPNDSSSNYPYTDCHQLRLCDDGYNSARSNKPFRYCDAGCSEFVTVANNGEGGGSGVYPGNSNWTSGSFTSGTWEVWIGRRGDIARAMFYMDVRYEGGTHGGTGAAEPNLILTDEESLIASTQTGSNESVAYMGMLSVLKQWHIEDPVDAFEQDRNDAVFGFQGNRNPFVDHPEWVEILYGDGDGGPATEPWINEFHYDNTGTDTGEFVEIAGPAGFDLVGWTLLGYDGASGNVYNTINLSGVLPLEAGCVGALEFAFPGLQNGGPDGLALVDPGGQVVHFLSYEGNFVANDGPALGMTSLDTGVSEGGTTPVGESLQLAGVGGGFQDFVWQSPALETPGVENNGQTFDGCCDQPAAAVFRNGGANPASYTVNAPVLGGPFTATIDLGGTTGHNLGTILGYLGAATQTLNGGQVLLLDLGHPAGDILQFPLQSGPLAVFSGTVPDVTSFCGLTVYTQAVHIGGVQPFALSNAYDLSVGN